jgi:hypothetical protein
MREVWMLVWFEVRRFIGRRRGLVWAVAALPLPALCGVLLAVSQIQHIDQPATRDLAFADLGNLLMGIEVLVALGIAVIATPALAAGSLAGEREMGTLESLLLTRLSTWQIVAAKLFLALIPTFVALYLLLPFLPAIILLRPAAAPEVLFDLGALLIVAIFIATAGFCCSTLFRRTVVAATVTYVLTGFLLGWPGLMVFAIDNLVSFPSQAVFIDAVALFVVAFFILTTAFVLVAYLRPGWLRAFSRVPSRFRATLFLLPPLVFLAIVYGIAPLLPLLSDGVRVGIAAVGTPMFSREILDTFAFQHSYYSYNFTMTPLQEQGITLFNLLGELVLAAAFIRIAIWRVDQLRRVE